MRRIAVLICAAISMISSVSCDNPDRSNGNNVVIYTEFAITKEEVGVDYIINLNTGKFHYPDCASVDQMAEHNKKEYTGDRDELILQGYEPCKRCNP